MILISIIWLLFAIAAHFKWADRWASYCGCILSLMFSVWPIVG